MKGNIIDINNYLNWGIVISAIGTVVFLMIYESGWENLGYGYGRVNFNGEYLSGVVICAVLLVGLLVFKFVFAKSEITVTDKRVYGKIAFGKRVDLPLDSISSVGIGFEWLKSVTVATSSGVIKFALVRNYRDVYQGISNLLLDRQNNGNRNNESVVNNTSNASTADELAKFKNLMDAGVITKEEFEAKKKQLLGL